MIALVQATFPDRATAEALTASLIEERLAACANLLPVHSIYRWQGGVERADEAAVQFKTRPDRAALLAERLSALHPYDLLAVEWWCVEASDRILDWVSEAVG